MLPFLNAVRLVVLLAPLPLLIWAFVYVADHHAEAMDHESGVLPSAFAPAVAFALLLLAVSMAPKFGRWAGDQVGEVFPIFARLPDKEGKPVIPRPVANPRFRDPAGVQAMFHEFVAVGFVRVGEYKFGPNPYELTVSLLVHPATGAIATAFESENTGKVIYEVEGQSPDGWRWAVTNYPDFRLSQPPRRTLVRMPGAGPREVSARFRQETAGEKLRPVSADSAAEVYADWCTNDLPYHDKWRLRQVQNWLAGLAVFAALVPPLGLFVGQQLGLPAAR